MYFAVVAVAASLGACRLFVDLDGLGDGAPATGGDATTDAALDRGIDSTSTTDGAIDGTTGSDGGADSAVDAEAGPPITFVSASTVAPFSGSSFDLAKPAGAVANDVVLVGVFTDFAATNVVTPATFAKLNDLSIGGSVNTRGWWYVHTVDAAEPAKTTFNLDMSSPFVSAVALAYRNVRVPSPVDVAAYGTSSGTAFIAPSVTTTRPRTMLVGIFMGDDTVTANWTAPTGMTERAVTGICAAFDVPFTNPGATGPVIAVSDQNVGGQNALIALAPKF